MDEKLSQPDIHTAEGFIKIEYFTRGLRDKNSWIPSSIQIISVLKWPEITDLCIDKFYFEVFILISNNNLSEQIYSVQYYKMS